VPNPAPTGSPFVVGVNVARQPQDESDRAPGSLFGARATFGLILLAVVLVLTVLLVVQNFQAIDVQFFQGEIRIRLGWALVAAAVIGSGLTLIFGRLFRRR
jgi:uncharacterized integral membrane protein